MDQSCDAYRKCNMDGLMVVKFKDPKIAQHICRKKRSVVNEENPNDKNAYSK